MILEARFRRLLDVVDPGVGLLRRLPAGTDAATDLLRRLPGVLCLTEPCCWLKFDVCLCCW